MFHCTQELELPLNKCVIPMMTNDPDDIWLNDQCSFGDKESGEIFQQLLEHYHGQAPGLCKLIFGSIMSRKLEF